MQEPGKSVLIKARAVRRSGPVARRICTARWSAAVCCCLIGTWAGCHRPGEIVVDLTGRPPRFTLAGDRGGRWMGPRVTEFAIASARDELMWQLASVDDSGVAAEEFAVVYGQIPPGFRQVFPAENKAPRSLAPRTNYYAACGDSRQVYRIVFALPDAGPWPATAPAGFGSKPAGPARDPASRPSG